MDNVNKGWCLFVFTFFGLLTVADLKNAEATPCFTDDLLARRFKRGSASRRKGISPAPRML